MESQPPSFEALLRGVSFRPIEAKAIVKDLEEGTGLLIEREPFNAFDANAVMVRWPEDDTHLGYVAKEIAAELAPWMDQGWHFTCVVDLRMSASVVSLKIEPIIPARETVNETSAADA